MKKGCLAVTLIVLAIEALGFLVIAGLWWVICYAFAFTFTWKMAIGIWAIYSILVSIFKVHVDTGKD